LPAVLVAWALLTGCQCKRAERSPGPAAADGGSVALSPGALAPPAGAPIVVASAGDIAGRVNRQGKTAALLLGVASRERLAAILPLGDLVYPRGEYHDFLAYYHPTWGHPLLRPLTRPVPGNHEYLRHTDARGYFDYWNGPGQDVGLAGRRGQGYYSFDLGDWHLIALNSSDGCQRVPCVPGSAMYDWLARDLAASTRRCVLAYWHHPRFQLGTAHKDSPRLAPLWDLLYDAHADVVLTGHDHNYQQLAPLDKDGRPDPARGIRSFVVGTGGAFPYPGLDPQQHPGAAETMFSHQVGVLLLTLESGAYGWRFLAADGSRVGRVMAQGRDVCR
jgi:acid phosphatase type 7